MLASSALFVNCTSDPIDGIDGTDGIAGVDGLDGLDGVDGSIESCLECHSAEKRDPIIDAFALSGHAAGAATGYAGGRESCSRCHSDEGYVTFITGKTAVDIVNPNPISCNTCHDTHSSLNFEEDENDLALRNIEPVALDLTDADYVIDYGDFSNNCISCHQPRSKAPVDEDGDGLYLQDDKRFYPHYGGQSTMLEGIQGAIIADGSTAYPEVGAAGHRNGEASCVTCHMGASDDGLSGSHTYIPSFSAPVCTTCHTTSVPTEVTGLAADMATLHTKLVDLGLIEEDGSTIVQTELIPFKSAQAIWNYKTVEEDHSNGVHNPKYAKALIKNALEAVE